MTIYFWTDTNTICITGDEVELDVLASVLERVGLGLCPYQNNDGELLVESHGIDLNKILAFIKACLELRGKRFTVL